MYKNKGSFRNSRIGRVPDRGGRITDDKCEGQRIVPKFNLVGMSEKKMVISQSKNSIVIHCSDCIYLTRYTRAYVQGRNSSSKSITKSGSHSEKGEFNEAQKVVNVFGSAMSSGGKVVASNK